MKTKLQLIHDTVNTLTLEHIAKDVEKQTGYGDRFMKAAKIVLSDGVKSLGHGEYEVHSGTEADIRYKVNGTCNCQDWKNWLKHEAWLKQPEGDDVKTYAPKGYCKHRIAAKFYAHTLAHLKNLVERFSLPHPHRWTCETHKHLPVECWEAVCPDPTDIACPTCEQAQQKADVTQEMVDSIVEILDDGAPTQEYTTLPAQQEDGPGETLREAELTVLQAQKEVHSPELVEGVDPHTGELIEPLPPLVYSTPQYEAAPVLVPHTAPLPEAPVSMCLTLRLPENHQLTYTLRGVTDADVLDRLPGVLARLEKIMHTEVDYELNFIQRLVRAFVPKKSAYQGK